MLNADEIILSEAQRIGTEFNFFMVENNIRHLWGVLVEHNGVQYSMELIFPAEYPNVPPEIQIEQNVADLFEEISLKSLDSWTPESHAIDVVKEFKMLIEEKLGIKKDEKTAVKKIQIAKKSSDVNQLKEPITVPQKTYELTADVSKKTAEKPQSTVSKEIPCPNCGELGFENKFCQNCGSKIINAPLPKADQECHAKKDTPKNCPSCGTEVKAGKFCPECGFCLDGTNKSQEKTTSKEKELEELTSDIGKTDAEPSESEYLTPNYEDFPQDEIPLDKSMFIPEGSEYPNESEKGSEEINIDQPKMTTSEPSTGDEAKKKVVKKIVKKIVKKKVKKSEVSTPKEELPKFKIDLENIDMEKVTEQASMIQNYYSVENINDMIGVNRIYISLPSGSLFKIIVNFMNYPKKPEVFLPDLGGTSSEEINKSIKVLANWDENKKPNVLAVIQEIENRLWAMNDIFMESKYIFGEYAAEKINGNLTNLKVSIMSYGFEIFDLEVDISEYPKTPKIKYSEKLAKIIKTPVENLSYLKNWKGKESHIVEAIREIAWLLEKNTRIDFELKLLKGLKKAVYKPESNSIEIEMSGQMKTKDLNFEFVIQLPVNYPMEAPKLTLKSELEGHEDVSEKLKPLMENFGKDWSTFSYLIDVFNTISKAIFEVSVLSCVICYKVECPDCQKTIASENPDDQCYAECKHCGRAYHKHCWDKTMQSFGKCGFCLRPP